MSENAVDSVKATPKRKPAKKANSAKKTAPVKKAAAKPKGDGTNKKAEVIAMMKRAKDATFPEIMKATGWQPHTVRGFVSILGSKGGRRSSRPRTSRVRGQRWRKRSARTFFATRPPVSGGKYRDRVWPIVVVHWKPCRLGVPMRAATPSNLDLFHAIGNAIGVLFEAETWFSSAPDAGLSDRRKAPGISLLTRLDFTRPAHDGSNSAISPFWAATRQTMCCRRESME